MNKYVPPYVPQYVIKPGEDQFGRTLLQRAELVAAIANRLDENEVGLFGSDNLGGSLVLLFPAILSGENFVDADDDLSGEAERLLKDLFNHDHPIWDYISARW
jgi:hypothetical protein